MPPDRPHTTSWIARRLARPGAKSFVGVLLAVHALLLVNAWLYDPILGEDGLDHVLYIQALSHGALPSRSQTREFFSPPLPYAVPAMLRALGLVSMAGAAKSLQLLNVVFSLGIALYLRRLCQLLAPGDPGLGARALFLLGMVPVYYRSMTQLKGEPLLALLTVAILYHVVRVFVLGEARTRQLIGLGVLAGLAVLARQWGLMLFFAVGLFAPLAALRLQIRWREQLRRLLVIGLVAVAVGAWFYLALWNREGSPTAFNRAAAQRFVPSNQPRSFYLGGGAGELFSDPIRPAFSNQLWPILYSTTWGDYWCYFLVKHRSAGAAPKIHAARGHGAQPVRFNRQQIRPYLARVNQLSLIPSAVLLCGLIWAFRCYGRGAAPAASDGRRTDVGPRLMLALLQLTVLCYLAGFVWFVIRYPSPGGDTIKAEYLLQIFPPLGLIVAAWLGRLKQRRRWIYLGLLAVLGLVAVHNVGAMITSYRTDNFATIKATWNDLLRQQAGRR